MKDKVKQILSLEMIQLSYCLKGTLWISVLLGGVELVLLYYQMITAKYGIIPNQHLGSIKMEPWSFRLEEFLAKSRWDILFIVAFFGILILLSSVTIRQWNQSNVEYTYQRLPLRRSYHPFVVVGNSIVCFFIFLSIQLGTILIGNLFYQTIVPENARMTQALFLAFLRWDFLRNCFPFFDAIQMIRLLALLFATGVFTMYFSYHIARRERPIILSVLYLGCIITFFGFQSLKYSILWLVILGITTFWMIVRYIQLRGRD